jgi:hypothetical protein
MSRRITVKTAFNNSEALTTALNELRATFTQEGSKFRVKEGVVDCHNAQGKVLNFMYTGVTVNVETGEGSFDEDCSNAKQFLEGPLKQFYSKALFMANAELDGDVITEQYVLSSDDVYVEGYDGEVAAGSIVFRSIKPVGSASVNL